MDNDKSSYRCPHCGSAISMEDINVATDVALCRSCEKAYSFALVSNLSEISPDCLKSPPRCIVISKDVQGEIRIVYHRLSKLLYFFIPFTAVWSGVTLWMHYGRQFVLRQFDLGATLGGIPFLVGTIVLLSAIAFLFLGKWIITLNRGKGTVFVGVFGLGLNRDFQYNRDSVVALQNTEVKVNFVPHKGILVRTNDIDFVFGCALMEDAKRFIASAITMEKDNLGRL